MSTDLDQQLEISLKLASGYRAAGWIHHNPEAHLLVFTDDEEFTPETLTVNLEPSYGLVAGEGEVFIKDWSEHEGLAQCLEDQGVIEIEEAVTVGPFPSTAFRCTVLI